MPTTRARHAVTETVELEQALDEAARLWPGLSRGQLVSQLAIHGYRAILAEREAVRARRREAATRAGRILSGTNARAQLAAMREEEWPE